MSDSLRYKIVLWIVWVQLALLPIAIVMVSVADNNVVIWRWNLVNNLMVGGYILGLLAFPVSRELEKPKLLKWWLRIDFWSTLILSIFALPLLFYCGRHYIDAEDGDYVLYHTTGLMAVAPHYNLGKKDGLFIHKLPTSVRINNYENGKINCFRVDTLKGFYYGWSCGAARIAWVLPLDSTKYRFYAADITHAIDYTCHSLTLLTPYTRGVFVFPDNFAEINYDGEQIYYTDSIICNIECPIYGDSIFVRFYNGTFSILPFSKDSIGGLSPIEVRTFINGLEKR